MKNTMILLFLSIAFNAFSQFDCSSHCEKKSAIFLTTGRDLNGVPVTAQTGNYDPNWVLVNNPPLVACTNPLQSSINGKAYAVNHMTTSTGWINQVGATALAPVDMGSAALSAYTPFGCNNATNSAGNGVPYIFERRFCVCKEAKVNIDFTFMADDQMYLELKNITTGTVFATTGNYIYASAAIHFMNPSLSLTPGKYVLRAYLINNNANTSANTLGFTVVGNITSTTPVFTNDKECCTFTTLTITKILDKNCDGKYNQGDTFGSGWTFNLLNSAGSVISTGVTDVNGNLVISGLSPGNYTIQEIPQSGWAPNSPASGSMPVNVTTNGINQYFFFNCPKESNGKFCCPDLKNLIINPQFNNPLAPSTVSQYTLDVPPASPNSTKPGEYILATGSTAASICNKWIVNDHTTCSATSGQVMIVDGETTQTSNASNVIWQQTVTGLQRDSTYKFCAFFKNLPACCFDVLPKIYVQVGSMYTSSWITINTTPGACDWQQVSFTFIANSTSAIIRIYIDEMGKGDGNDLAIDDLSLSKIGKANAQFSVLNESLNNNTACKITASLNSISSSDDYLGSNCKYLWIIGQWDLNLSPPWFVPSPVAGGSYGYPWGTTTSFTPGFNCIPGVPFLIYLAVFDCDCLQDNYDYQITLNSKLQKLTKKQEQVLHKTMHEYINKIIKK